MTEFKGSILELNKKHVIVMTENCDFISLKKQPRMFVGQQISFKKSDMVRTNRSYMKLTALTASVLLLVFCSVLFFQLFNPGTVFAYIDIDINPSIEFAIDKNSKVIDIKPLNDEAQTLLNNLDLTDLPVKQAISHVIDTSEKLGYIGSEKSNEVLVSASIDDNKNPDKNISSEKALDSILSDISTISITTGSKSQTPEVLKVSPQVHKTAVENNISMGRYELYEKLKEKNPDLTVETAKSTHVSDMLNDPAVKSSEKFNSKKTAFSTSKFNNSKSKYGSSKNSQAKQSNPAKSSKQGSGFGFGFGSSAYNGSYFNQPFASSSWYGGYSSKNNNNSSGSTNSNNNNKSNTGKNSSSSNGSITGKNGGNGRSSFFNGFNGYSYFTGKSKSSEKDSNTKKYAQKNNSSKSNKAKKSNNQPKSNYDKNNTKSYK